MASTYLQKQALYGPLVEQPPAEELSIVVVIPSYEEPDTIRSLQSLWKSDLPSRSVEVIVVVNCGEHESSEVRSRAEATHCQLADWFKENHTSRLKGHSILAIDLPRKHAGVGLARKIGMDEAVRRFEAIGKDGIIVCFDADSLCEQNYFTAIEDHFKQFPESAACSLAFEHPTSCNDFAPEVYDAIIDYELHLRYYIAGLRFAGHPHAFHTIGSSMAVRRSMYEQVGGMNKRKAGEDFYFLQKIIANHGISNLTATTVIPSPRPSHRVPFGTGRAVKQSLDDKEALTTYDPRCFFELKQFLELVELQYSQDLQGLESQLPIGIGAYLDSINWKDRVLEIRANTTSQASFKKRFFQWFDAFQALKFVHFYRDEIHPNVPVIAAASELLDWLAVDYASRSALDLLKAYRVLDEVRQ